MSRRQKLLLIAAAILLAAFLADTGYRKMYAQPLALEQRRREQLQEQLHESRLLTRREEQKLKQLDELESRSLSQDLELAITAYRSWLLSEIERVGLRQTSVDSGQPNNVRNLFRRIDFTIRGQGTLNQIVDLLQQFYAMDTLHRIRSMSFTPTEGGSIDLSLTIEALTLPTALPAGMAQPTSLSAASAERGPYLSIIQRNLFAAGESPLSSMHLSAITVDAEGRRQAWINDAAEGITHHLAEGDMVRIGPYDIAAASIGDDHVTVELNGQTVQVPMGRSLDQTLPVR